MDLNLLTLFVTVADASSFSAAAERMGLPRSSVSRNVAALEAALGVQLFHRTTRQVALSTAGQALYERVAPQLAALQQSLVSLPEREEQPSGELRVTAPNDMGATFLPDAIARFSARYPAVQVDVRLTNRIVDLVAEGFDVALRIAGGGQLADSSLMARRLSELDSQVFASPSYLARQGHPRAPEDTADHDWVVFRSVPVPPPPLAAPRNRPRIVADDMLFVREAVRAGCGLGLLPSFLAQEDVAAGRLVRVLPRTAQTVGALYLVHPPSQHVPKKITAFRDFLLEFLAAHPLRS